MNTQDHRHYKMLECVCVWGGGGGGGEHQVIAIICEVSM